MKIQLQRTNAGYNVYYDGLKIGSIMIGEDSVLGFDNENSMWFNGCYHRENEIPILLNRVSKTLYERAVIDGLIMIYEIM